MVHAVGGQPVISQSVREILQTEAIRPRKRRPDHDLERHQHVRRRPRAGRGGAPRQPARRRLRCASGLDFNVSLIFGGQIAGEGMRLFLVYSAGNFIEATAETPYFQIGESKYGKPVLDRVITPDTPLDEAAKCALVSMDSTLKSNLSVGCRWIWWCTRLIKLQSDRVICIDEDNPYFTDAAQSWGQKPARGVRQHRRPPVERRRHRGAADACVGALQAAEKNHLTQGKADLRPRRTRPVRLKKMARRLGWLRAFLRRTDLGVRTCTCRSRRRRSSTGSG
jgi:predicted proteasome-type protease